MIKNLVIVSVVIGVIFIVPFITIWALNALFPALAIPYTLETWAASCILTGFISTKGAK